MAPEEKYGRKEGIGMGEIRRQDIEWSRQEYRQKFMTEEQFEAMKEKMEQAKRVKRKRTYKWKAAAAAAAAAVTVMLMPNVWPDAAYAMDGVPFVGNLVNTVSFHSFRYEDERNRAEIAVDKIAVSETDIRRRNQRGD